MTPYRERAPVSAEEPEMPPIEPPPPRVIVRRPGTPLAIWVLAMAIMTAIVASQLHLR